MVACLLSKELSEEVCQGDNFTNILQATFSSESVFCNFSVFTVLLCNYLAKEYLAKKLIIIKCW